MDLTRSVQGVLFCRGAYNVDTLQVTETSCRAWGAGGFHRVLSYRQLSATSVISSISSQRLHSNMMRGSARSYTLYTMIYLIFHKNRIKSIIEIGLAGVREADFRR